MDQQGLPPHLCLGGKGLGMAESNIHLDVWGRWAQRAGSVPFPNISPGSLACQEVHSHAQTRSSQRAAFSRARVHIQGGKEWLKMDMGLLGGDRTLSMGYPSLGQPLDTSIEDVQN